MARDRDADSVYISLATQRAAVMETGLKIEQKSQPSVYCGIMAVTD